MEFRGGTYIAQVKAASVEKAIRLWSNTINDTKVAHFGVYSKLELQTKILNNSVERVNETSNVWCTCTSLRTGFVNVYIIKTQN